MIIDQCILKRILDTKGVLSVISVISSTEADWAMRGANKAEKFNKRSRKRHKNAFSAPSQYEESYSKEVTGSSVKLVWTNKGKIDQGLVTFVYIREPSVVNQSMVIKIVSTLEWWLILPTATQLIAQWTLRLLHLHHLHNNRYHCNHLPVLISNAEVSTLRWRAILRVFDQIRLLAAFGSSGGGNQSIQKSKYRLGYVYLGPSMST